MKFSVLMSIYYKEKPEYFTRAMQSIWDEQIVKPDEIVLVQDGPLTKELYFEINKWKSKLVDIFKIVFLNKNVGLGDALNEGIKYCSHELIARMDTDDISLPERFKKQLNTFQEKDIDICSSWVSEFDKDENEIISYRKLPEKHNEIVNYSKMRNAINHPSVMYKKSMIKRAGGYKKMMWLEDYYLWVRMIINGSVFYNLQEVLVNMRAGYEQLERRSGLSYAKSELEFLSKLRELGFLNNYEYIKNILIKTPIRIMPKGVIKNVYKLIRSKD